MIITIDGLSATGKSTVAKRLAHTLHYLYFNTGLVYRMVTYVILKNHLTDPKTIVDSLNQLDFELESDQIVMNHQNITNILYTDEISLSTSKYSSILEIKEWVRSIQKKYLKQGNIIMEGRDIGSRVARDADIKFYLYASLDARAKRLRNRTKKLTLEEAKRELKMIDEKNMTSKDFIKPVDAIQIDTTDMSLEEVYTYMLSMIQKKF